MQWLMFLYTMLLFILFVPGQVFTIPGGKSKTATVVIHSIAFAITCCMLHRFLWGDMGQINYLL